MQKFGIKAMVILIASILLTLCLPIPALAAGLGVSPPSIEITEVLRGNEYNRTITFFSSATEPVDVTLSVLGTSKDG